MNKNTLVCGLILTATFMQPSLIFSANTSNNNTNKDKTSIKQQFQHSHSLAHKMLGHINLAKFALGIKLPREATHQIEKAQIIKTQLEEQLPERKIYSTFNYGKVTYDDKHTIKEHYVPVIDDILLISNCETIFEHLKELNLKETSASVVHVGISVDLREVKTALDTALQDIKKKEYGKAQSALTAIFKGAIIDEEEIDDPVLSIAENMALAKAFLNNGQYDKSRYTLKYIQKRLTSVSNIDRDNMNKFSDDLKNLKAELRMKDPTMTQSIGDQVDNWRKKFRNWFG